MCMHTAQTAYIELFVSDDRCVVYTWSDWQIQKIDLDSVPVPVRPVNHRYVYRYHGPICCLELEPPKRSHGFSSLNRLKFRVIVFPVLCLDIRVSIWSKENADKNHWRFFYLGFLLRWDLERYRGAECNSHMQGSVNTVLSRLGFRRLRLTPIWVWKVKVLDLSSLAICPWTIRDHSLVNYQLYAPLWWKIDIRFRSMLWRFRNLACGELLWVNAT